MLDIQKILGGRPYKPEFIETVPKRGYRFIAPVIDESAAEQAELSTPQETEGKITKEKAEPGTARSELKSASGRQVLLKAGIIAALVVAAVTAVNPGPHIPPPRAACAPVS